MFKFLRGLFGEEEQKEEVMLEDIEEWLEDKSRPAFESLNASIRQKIADIKIEASNLRENADSLEFAEVKEPEKIQSKVKNVVLGHRNNYLRILSHFLDRIRFDADDYKKALEFCNTMENELNSIGTGSVKSYYTVQHLFPEHVEKIAACLRNINSHIKSIRQEIIDRKIDDIELARIRIRELKDSIRKKQLIIKNIDDDKLKSAELKESEEKLEKRKAELMQSDELAEYNRLKGRLAEIEDDLAGIGNKITELFAPLESPLRKFQRVTFENVGLAEKYAADPIDSLLEDKELAIVELLAAMRKSIENGSIELNEKKRERAIEQIMMITREGLKRILEDYTELSGQKNDTEIMLKSINALNQVKQIEYKLDFYKNKIEQISRDISSLESNMEKIDIDKQKIELKELIKKAVNVEVSIPS